MLRGSPTAQLKKKVFLSLKEMLVEVRFLKEIELLMKDSALEMRSKILYDECTTLYAWWTTTAVDV